MAGITQEQAQEQLDKYLAAETAVLGSQSYEIAGRKLNRADLGEIQAGIKVWDERVKALARSAMGKRRSRTMIVRG